MYSAALSMAGSRTCSGSDKTSGSRAYMMAPRRCCAIRYWFKRWAHGDRERSLRRLRGLLELLPPVKACDCVLECVRSSYDPDVIRITPLLLREVYDWHRKVPNHAHRQVWYALRHFIRRRLSHHAVKVRKASLEAAEDAFCFGAADKRRLFFQNILHPQEEIWLTIVDWAEYVAWRDLVSLLLQEHPWRQGTAWNVLFALDNWVIDRMDEAQKQELLDAVKRVLLYVDELCLLEFEQNSPLLKRVSELGKDSYYEHTKPSPVPTTLPYLFRQRGAPSPASFGCSRQQP